MRIDRRARSGPPCRPPRARCSPRPRPRCPPRRRAACGSRRAPSTGRRRRGRGSSRPAVLERKARVEDEPAVGRRACAHLAAVDLHALADARRARGRGRRSPAAPTPSSRTSICSSSRRVADGHVGVAGARVLERRWSGPPGRSDTPRGRSPRPSATGSPSTWSRTGRPARPTSSTSDSRLPSPGCGRELDVVAVAAHGAEEPAHLGERRAAGLLDALERVRPPGSSGSLCRTAPTWSTITLTAWATTSWSSRAIRARSSATAIRAAASRSRSAMDRAQLGRLRLLGALAQHVARDPAEREQDGMKTQMLAACRGRGRCRRRSRRRR